MSPEVKAQLKLAKPEHIKAAVDRANDMLNRAKLVNAAQYAHGINSTVSWIEYYLRGVAKGEKGDYGGLEILRSKTMQLGGYLYSLKEGI